MPNQDLRCPKCGQPDQVRKVNDIYAAGAPGTGDAGQLLLRSKLAPPAEPLVTTEPSLMAIFAVACFFLGLYLITTIGGSVTLGLAGVMLAITGVVLYSNEWHKGRQGQ